MRVTAFLLVALAAVAVAKPSNPFLRSLTPGTIDRSDLRHGPSTPIAHELEPMLLELETLADAEDVSMDDVVDHVEDKPAQKSTATKKSDKISMWGTCRCSYADSWQRCGLCFMRSIGVPCCCLMRLRDFACACVTRG